MPSISREQHHITLTQSGGIPPDDPIEKNLLDYIGKKCYRYFVVAEYGKNGNRHIHAVVQFPNKRRTSSLHCSFGPWYGKIRTSKPEVVIHKVDNWPMLVGGYLCKESGEILLKSDDIELNDEVYRAGYLRWSQMRTVRNKKISFYNAHIVIKEFCTQGNHPVANWEDFKRVIVLMVQEGYAVHCFMNKMYLVYSIFMSVYHISNDFLLDRLEGSRARTIRMESPYN